jgi:hypothetical protein
MVLRLTRNNEKPRTKDENEDEDDGCRLDRAPIPDTVFSKQGNDERR